jgi:hypothetical protein
MYAALDIPEGWFVLSLYDFNKDGHQGPNRWRDYHVSVRARPQDVPQSSIDGWEKWPELARSRIHDFRGGVWKRFLVRGPQNLTIEVNRNFSYNTVVAGIFLDRMAEQPSPYFGTWQEMEQRGQTQAQQRRRVWLLWRDSIWRAERMGRLRTGRNAEENAQRVWQGLQEARWMDAVWHESEGTRFYLALLRWHRSLNRAANRVDKTASKSQTLPDAAKAKATSVLPPAITKLPVPVKAAPVVISWQSEALRVSLYQLRLYDEWESEQRRQGLRPARDIEKALKWDGKSDNSGRGHTVVTEYLNSLANPSPPTHQPPATDRPAGAR